MKAIQSIFNAVRWISGLCLLSASFLAADPAEAPCRPGNGPGNGTCLTQNGNGHGNKGNRCLQGKTGKNGRQGMNQGYREGKVLSPEEAASLHLMREEEKLAHDVYTHLHARYGDRPFSNISQAERRHMDAVLWLMEANGIEDQGNPEPGQFSDTELQTLYAKLIDLGNQSRAHAFVVGVIIEEIDIADLDAALTATANEDLVNVFSNLRAGSRRHLQAFQRGLQRLSDDPQTLLKEAKADLGINLPAPS